MEILRLLPLLLRLWVDIVPEAAEDCPKKPATVLVFCDHSPSAPGVPHSVRTSSARPRAREPPVVKDGTAWHDLPERERSADFPGASGLVVAARLSPTHTHILAVPRPLGAGRLAANGTARRHGQGSGSRSCLAKPDSRAISLEMTRHLLPESQGMDR